MRSQLNDRVGRWVASTGIDPAIAPTPADLEARFGCLADPCRTGADPREIDAWERRHGYSLPQGLRNWLVLSNGFYVRGPLIHPLSAIGPMVPFARMPELLVQPESWFELAQAQRGGPVCIDLALSTSAGPRRWRAADLHLGRPFRRGAAPLDRHELRRSRSWNCSGEVKRNGGSPLGFPIWVIPGRYFPTVMPLPPPLPDRLRALAVQVRPLMRPGADDRSIASSLGITRGDVETLFRHLQHGSR